MKTFAIGDIHGGYKALKQCLNAARFYYGEDQLIVLGDVCDGWPQTKECINELLQIKNLIFIVGNHDWWTYCWALRDCKMEWAEEAWVTQGGLSTLESYNYKMPPEHIKFLASGTPLYIDDKNRAFVHGGFDRKKDARKQDQQVLMWDRNLIQTAYNLSKQGGDKPQKLTEFEEVFLGHTPVSTLGGLDTPLNFFEIWNLDTGAGWEGKLTIMNVDTHEYWQSDVVHELYPGEHGRQGEQMRRRIKGYLG